MSEYDRVIHNKLALVIGVGSGACKALNHNYLCKKVYEIDFLAIDTDKHALARLDIPTNQQMIIGKNLTMGIGTEAKPELGRESAIESIHTLKKIISKDYKIVFILAGMGGETGTGAVPIIAELCHNLDCIVITIVSIPGHFEGKIINGNIQNRIDLLTRFSDIVLTLSIDSITNSHKNLSSSQIFQCSDSFFKAPIDVILRMFLITKHSIYPNVDLDDIKTVIQGANGVSAVISGIGNGKNRIKEALLDMFGSPYLLDFTLESVNSILVFTESGIKNEITMSEIGKIIDYLQEEIGNDTVIIWGSGFDADLKAEIRISALLSPKLPLFEG
jgi:cell division protein FtsZ